MKVYNISREDIGIILPNYEGSNIQYNLQPHDYILVKSLTTQIKQLADPSIKKLRIVRDGKYILFVNNIPEVTTTVNGVEGDQFEFNIDDTVVVKSVIKSDFYNKFNLKELRIKLK